MTFVGGAVLSLGGDYFTFNTDMHGWSARAGLGIPLAALFPVSVAPGLVSLDFTGNQSAGAAKARVRIPLN